LQRAAYFYQLLHVAWLGQAGLHAHLLGQHRSEAA